MSEYTVKITQNTTEFFDANLALLDTCISEISHGTPLIWVKDDITQRTCVSCRITRCADAFKIAHNIRQAYLNAGLPVDITVDPVTTDEDLILNVAYFTTTVRFTSQGTPVVTEASAEEVNPSKVVLKNIIESTPRAAQRLAKVEQYIRAHTIKTTPMPWDNQQEFGKIFLTKQLLAPKPEISA